MVIHNQHSALKVVPDLRKRIGDNIHLIHNEKANNCSERFPHGKLIVMCWKI